MRLPGHRHYSDAALGRLLAPYVGLSPTTPRYAQQGTMRTLTRRHESRTTEVLTETLTATGLKATLAACHYPFFKTMLDHHRVVTGGKPMHLAYNLYRPHIFPAHELCCHPTRFSCFSRPHGPDNRMPDDPQPDAGRQFRPARPTLRRHLRRAPRQSRRGAPVLRSARTGRPVPTHRPPEHHRLVRVADAPPCGPPCCSRRRQDKGDAAPGVAARE